MKTRQYKTMSRGNKRIRNDDVSTSRGG
jgi:hypothetical protein